LIDEILYTADISCGSVNFLRTSGHRFFCDSTPDAAVRSCYEYNCVSNFCSRHLALLWLLFASRT